MSCSSRLLAEMVMKTIIIYHVKFFMFLSNIFKISWVVAENLLQNVNIIFSLHSIEISFDVNGMTHFPPPTKSFYEVETL